MHTNQLESHTIPIERSLIKKVKGSYQQYTQFFAKKCHDKARKQKQDCLKPITEEISALDQKKVHFKNLIKDLSTESDDKLGYNTVKAHKFETMKTTLEKSHVLKRATDQKPNKLDSCIEKR